MSLKLFVLLAVVAMAGGVRATVSDPVDVFAHPERCWLWKVAPGHAADSRSETLGDDGLASVWGHGVDSAVAHIRFPGHREWTRACVPALLPLLPGSTGLSVDGVPVADAPCGVDWYLWRPDRLGVSYALSLTMPYGSLAAPVTGYERGGGIIILR